MPFQGTAFAVVALDPVHAHAVASFDFERAMVAAKVDGVPAAARRLAADRAIAVVIGIGVGRFETERNRATMAGTF
jgi:hypothetical protein